MSKTKLFLSATGLIYSEYQNVIYCEGENKYEHGCFWNNNLVFSCSKTNVVINDQLRYLERRCINFNDMKYRKGIPIKLNSLYVRE
jgi:hypothetical protein